MKLQLSQNIQIPYLDYEIVQEYSNLIIQSNDGQKVLFNHYMLVSWSKILKVILKDVIDMDHNFVISCNLSHCELNILHDFIMKGILPTSEWNITNGKLSSEIETIFQTFGIDLKTILESICIKSNLYNDFQYKIENDEQFTENNSENVEPKNIVKIEFKDRDNIDFVYQEDENVIENQFQKSQAKGVNKREKNNSCEVCNRSFASNYSLKRHVASKICETDDWLPESSKDHEGFISKLKKFKNSKQRCPECLKVIQKNSLYKHLRVMHNKTMNEVTKIMKTVRKNMFKEQQDPELYEDETTHSTIRGLRAKIDKYMVDHYIFITHKKLLELKDAFRDTFTIQIPPADFTEDEYKNFTFPKPTEAYEIVPQVLAKYSEVCPTLGASICGVCNQSGLGTRPAMEEHHTKIHSIHYKCPFENCKYAVQKNKNGKHLPALFRFARHIYFHNHDFPQFAFPHECIACGFKTSFSITVRSHMRNQGPYHDNQCPRCSDRLNSREELLRHIRENNHDGYRCGFCKEVFDTLPLRNKHRLLHLSRPRSEDNPIPNKKRDNTMHICEDCGKTFKDKYKLNSHRKNMHGDGPIKIPSPAEKWPCEHCGKVYKSLCSLKKHVPFHLSKKPCTICGKLMTRYVTIFGREYFRKKCIKILYFLEKFQ